MITQSLKTMPLGLVDFS